LGSYDSQDVVRGLEAHIRLTADLISDFPLLIVHLGVIPQAESQDLALENCVKNLKKVLPLAEDLGVTICLENVPAYMPGAGFSAIGSDYHDLLTILRACKSHYLKICYDWGHANAMGRMNYESDKKRYSLDYLKKMRYHHELIDCLAPEIVYTHLHYNSAHLELDKMLRKEGGAVWDMHWGINRISDKKTAEEYKKIVQKVAENTALLKYGGKILLELVPKWAGPLLNSPGIGADKKDALESVKILRRWLNQS